MTLHPLLANASELDDQQHERIHRKLVHKTNLHHVFVERIEALPPNGQGWDRFSAQLIIDEHHPFFFEHPLDHVPGLMLIEGMRQVGTAISHLYYDVPFDMVFILNGLDVKFTNFAELTSPIFIEVLLVDKVYRRERLTGLSCHGKWLQDERLLGVMDAEWSFSPAAVLARLRHAATFSQPAGAARVNPSFAAQEKSHPPPLR